MSDTVIRVEDVSKQYRLGTIGTGTLSSDLKRWFYKVRGKEDPFLKIGEENDRTKKGSSDYVWALKDVSFDIQKGDVVGVIGKNGAGKSTLLKLLSRTTLPTAGTIKVKGRIASLLEVGTGFHPELTGRENIFLNGAILGMRKAEIQSKFDEIVDFAGVGRYVDTPVKRYSSGMYVRLAFAVAAHLDPEILIVDEVLAVGDAEFQQKCIGKMQDVSKSEGRTVLFVSHNMSAVSSLCSKAIVLSKGTTIFQGPTESSIDFYLNNIVKNKFEQSWSINLRPGDDVVRLASVRLTDPSGSTLTKISLSDRIDLELSFEVLEEREQLFPNIHLYTKKNDYLFVSSLDKNHQPVRQKGKYIANVSIPANLLNEGGYKIGVAVTSLNPTRVHCHQPEVLSFDVVEEDLNQRANDFNQKIPGFFRPVLEWQIKKQLV